MKLYVCRNVEIKIICFFRQKNTHKREINIHIKYNFSRSKKICAL